MNDNTEIRIRSHKVDIFKFAEFMEWRRLNPRAPKRTHNPRPKPLQRPTNPDPNQTELF